LGGLLPLWGTALLLSLFGKSFILFEFLKNGEFVLYSASFIGGAMYTIRKDVFPSKNFLNILFFSLLAICLLVFVAITISLFAKEEALPKLSPEVLTKISIAVFIVSTIACFLVTLADAAGAGADVPDAMKRDGKSLDRTFENLLREQEMKDKGTGNG